MLVNLYDVSKILAQDNKTTVINKKLYLEKHKTRCNAVKYTRKEEVLWDMFGIQDLM